MGRAQLADPEFCSKAKSGNIDDIDYLRRLQPGVL